MDYTKLAADIAGWMRDYAASAGAAGYVIGLSGGIDSAVTAALATRAVGVEHALGALLPCHSQPEDAAYAQQLAESLRLPTVTVDLGTTYEALIAALPAGPDTDLERLARANVKPRLRMTALYALAQVRNALVAGTGNKPELLVGYFTKYGDGGVDIEPLGELYKHEVRALARALGVPDAIVKRPPTAGLWPGQTDEGELGITYDNLDAILATLTEGHDHTAPQETIDRVRHMVNTTTHKRALPPTYPVQRR